MSEKPPLPFFLDGTMRATFRACERKFFNAYVLKLVTPSPSIHLHAGKAYATACETTRLARYGQGADWEEAIDAGQAAMIRSWTKKGSEPPDPCGTGKTLENMLALHDAYFRHYDMAGSDLIPLIRSEGNPAVEFSFAIPIPDTCHPLTGEEFLYVGRLDMLAQREGSPNVWAVDEKTTSRLGPKWGQQWELRGQFIGYTWAVLSYGYPCAGAIVRGAKVTTTGNIDFAEVPIPINRHVIDRWLEELKRDCDRISEAYLQNSWRYDFADACSAYSGCEYQIACGAKDPERWLQANFVENTWTPVPIPEGEIICKSE